MSASPLLLDDDPQPQERSRQERIRTLAVGVPCLYGHLPCDNAFYGFGPDRREIMIGVEVKRPKDMAICITQTGRLVQQFRHCVEFGISVMYLVFQGVVKEDTQTGLLMELRYGGVWETIEPAITYNQMDNYFNTLDKRGGVTVKKTAWPDESAKTIYNLYHWWQRSPEEHTSMDRFNGADGAALLSKNVPYFRRVVKESEGVGWRRSADFLKTFTGQGLSTLDVLNMERKDWMKVPGIGKVTAQNMWDELHEPI